MTKEEQIEELVEYIIEAMDMSALENYAKQQLEEYRQYRRIASELLKKVEQMTGYGIDFKKYNEARKKLTKVSVSGKMSQSDILEFIDAARKYANMNLKFVPKAQINDGGFQKAVSGLFQK